MSPIEVSSWESFEEKLKEMRQAEVSAKRNVEFLFRGLSDSTLTLATTLERAGREGISVSEYYDRIEALSLRFRLLLGGRGRWIWGRRLTSH